MFDSPWHWAVVAIVAFVLFFGWKNLPDMSRSLGRSLRIFKTEIKGMGQDDKDRAEAETAKALEAPPAQAQVVKNPAARPVAPTEGATPPDPPAHRAQLGCRRPPDGSLTVRCLSSSWLAPRTRRRRSSGGPPRRPARWC